MWVRYNGIESLKSILFTLFFGTRKRKGFNPEAWVLDEEQWVFIGNHSTTKTDILGPKLKMPIQCQFLNIFEPSGRPCQSGALQSETQRVSKYSCCIARLTIYSNNISISAGRARPRGPGGILMCIYRKFQWIGFCMFKYWLGGPREAFPEVV